MRPSLGYSTMYWSNLDRKKAESKIKEVFHIDDEPTGEPLNENLVEDAKSDPPPENQNKIQQSDVQNTSTMLPLKKPNQFGGNNGVENTQDRSFRHRDNRPQRS